MGNALTHKQGGMLFRLTLRKFWEHQTPPDIRQASDLIGACLAACKGRAAADVAVAVGMVRKWYPEFSADDLAPRFGKRTSKQTAKPAGKSTGRKREKTDPRPAPEPVRPAPGPMPEPEPASEPEPEPAPEPEPEPVKPEPEPGPATNLQLDIQALVGAGLEQILVVGPAGCGKSTCMQLAAEALQHPHTFISCSEAMPAYTFTGRRHPMTGAYEDTEFTQAYAAGNIIILDEFEKLDPCKAACVNAALANGHLPTPDGPILRGAGCVVMANGNTWGSGADRQYCGSNQLDAATLDRFAGGKILADYDLKYEKTVADPDIRTYCAKIRKRINDRHLRRICSTRMLQACQKRKNAGLAWREQITIDWATTEKDGL